MELRIENREVFKLGTGDRERKEGECVLYLMASLLLDENEAFNSCMFFIK